MANSARTYRLTDDIILEVENEYLSPEIEQKFHEGTYEVAVRAMIEKHVPKFSHLPAVEIGSCIGATTTTLARNTDEYVIAVEAHPKAKDVLKRTRELNDVNYEIVSAAYDPRGEGPVEFRVGTENMGFFESSVMEEHEIDLAETIEVPGTTLQQLRMEFAMDEFILVMNAEGAERLLMEEPEQLRRCPLIITEVHAVERDVHTADYGWFLDEMGDYFELAEVADGDHNITAVFKRK